MLGRPDPDQAGRALGSVPAERRKTQLGERFEQTELQPPYDVGGAPLAQGTAYLLFSKRTADRLTAILVAVVALAGIGVLLSPLDLTLVEPYRLSGRVLVWQWVRAFTPSINIYAFVVLVGGAAMSAWRYARRAGMERRSLANIWIAVGGLLPGIGGTFTRFGHVEVLYVTEFLGLIGIYIGFRIATAGAPASVLPGGTTPVLPSAG